MCEIIEPWLLKLSTAIVFGIVTVLCVILSLLLSIFLSMPVMTVPLLVSIGMFRIYVLWIELRCISAQIAARKLSHSSPTSKPFQLPAQSPHQPPSPVSNPTHLGSSNPSPHFPWSGLPSLIVLLSHPPGTPSLSTSLPIASAAIPLTLLSPTWYTKSLSPPPPDLPYSSLLWIQSFIHKCASTCQGTQPLNTYLPSTVGCSRSQVTPAIRRLLSS
jgi:hypothetical protein